MFKMDPASENRTSNFKWDPGDALSLKILSFFLALLFFSLIHWLPDSCRGQIKVASATLFPHQVSQTFSFLAPCKI